VIISHFAEQLGLSPGQLDSLLEKAEPPAVPPPSAMTAVRRRPESVEPLTAAQKRLVAFMVLNPRFFTRLAEGGLRDCLVGSVGEIVFLQLRRLIDTRTEVEPEELLSVLPEGAERAMVSDMLLEAMDGGGGDDQAEMDEEEIVELLQWIRQYGLQRSSERLLKRINAVQSTGNFAELQELLREKQRIDRALQGVDTP
jgi:DNA primase